MVASSMAAVVSGPGRPAGVGSAEPGRSVGAWVSRRLLRRVARRGEVAAWRMGPSRRRFCLTMSQIEFIAPRDRVRSKACVTWLEPEIPRALKAVVAVPNVIPQAPRGTVRMLSDVAEGDSVPSSGCARTVQPLARSERRRAALSDQACRTVDSASPSSQKMMFTGMSVILRSWGSGSRRAGKAVRLMVLLSGSKEPEGVFQPSIRRSEGARGPVRQVQAVVMHVPQSLPRKEGRVGCDGGAGSAAGSAEAAARAAALREACFAGPAELKMA